MVCSIQIVTCLNVDETNNYAMKHCKFKNGNFKCIIAGKALDNGILVSLNLV
jgi:hypothetical protein